MVSGGLTVQPEGFELHGRDQHVSVPFSDVSEASIARASHDRLRGLPVLMLLMAAGGQLRIASLEGLGVLHELAADVEAAGLQVTV